MFVTRNVRVASTIVTAILPVRLAPPGKITMRPIRFIRNMKKNTVSRYGANLEARSLRVLLMTLS